MLDQGNLSDGQNNYKRDRYNSLRLREEEEEEEEEEEGTIVNSVAQYFASF